MAQIEKGKKGGKVERWKDGMEMDFLSSVEVELRRREEGKSLT
jgi:hypothetical protein